MHRKDICREGPQSTVQKMKKKKTKIKREPASLMESRSGASGCVLWLFHHQYHFYSSQSFLESWCQMSLRWTVCFLFCLPCPHHLRQRVKKETSLSWTLWLPSLTSFGGLGSVRPTWISTCDLQPVPGGRLDSSLTSCSTAGRKASDSVVLVREAMKKVPF